MSEITNQPLYLIKFDDTEVPDETMFGAEIANKRFEQISGNWNAHLFVKVASNSRDDACSGSNAKLASDYDALAAQRDEGLAREAELQSEVQRLAFERQPLEGAYSAVLKQNDALQQRLAEAEKLLNSPELYDFAKGVVNEAAHQRGRWASDHDSGKSPADWFWLIGYLAQKAMTAQMAGNTDKALHHCISTAAALNNWHAAISGANSDMRPGIANPGDADVQKARAQAVNLPRRKVKTEYSTTEEGAQADAWNAALDAVQELNR